MTFKTGKGQHSRYQEDGGGNKAKKEDDGCPQILERPESEWPDRRQSCGHRSELQRAASTANKEAGAWWAAGPDLDGIHGNRMFPPGPRERESDSNTLL